MTYTILQREDKEVVSLELACQSLGLIYDDVKGDLNESLLIETCIAAALERVEGLTGLVLIPSVVLYECDDLQGVLELVKCPVKEITEFSYLDPSQSISYVDLDQLRVDLSSKPCRVQHISQWPKTASLLNSVAVTYKAGYDSENELPKLLKQAILMLVNHYYTNREPVIIGTVANEIPEGVKVICNMLKVRQ